MSSAITRHFDAHVGEAAAHYAVYPGPSGLMHRVRPTEARPWTTLYTDGMRARELPESEDLDDTRVELVVGCSRGFFADDHGGPVDPAAEHPGEWLVELLQYVMLLPWRIDYPVYAGLIVPNGEPPEPYSEGLAFRGLLVAPVASLPTDAQEVDTDVGRVRLLSLVLLRQDELDYVAEHGVDALYQRLDAHGVFEMVDPERGSVVADG